METVLTVFNLLSPFIAGVVTYFFFIKEKRKEVDIEKEKELNTVLSNLLVSWHYLTRIELIIETMSEKKKKILFPKQQLPALILNTGFLDDDCFNDLDESIVLLKKYDPITYYKLEGLGRRLSLTTRQYIMPLLNDSKLSNDYIVNGVSPFLDTILDDVENYLEAVSQNINSKTQKNIKNYIDSYLDENSDTFIEELNMQYYEMMIGLMPLETRKPTFKEFEEAANSGKFDDLQQVQLKIALDGTLTEALNLIHENPNISFQEIMTELELIRKKNLD